MWVKVKAGALADPLKWVFYPLKSGLKAGMG